MPKENLAQTEDLFRALLEMAPDAVVVTDTKGMIVLVNAQAVAMFGFTRDEMVGHAIEMLVPPRFRKGHSGKRDAYIADPAVRPMGIGMNLVAVGKNEKEIPVEISLSPIETPQGLLIVSAVRDVSERRKAEAARQKLESQIQHTQKLESLGVLAGGIAHDFNNLLVAILGNADLALKNLSPTAPGREELQDIAHAAQRAAELCKQMLAYSGKGKFVVKVVELSEVVEEMGHLLEVVISKKAVLKYEFAKGLPGIEVDVTQLRQVIMNLITNASEAIGDKSGIISMTTGAMECDTAYLKETFLADDLPAGTYVYLEIADTGCGMDKETEGKIFDPFFTTKFAGRGLGLAAVLGIVRGHHGAIKVYSEPDRGTTIKILFPCVDRPAETIAQTDGAAPLWEGSGTILVVDDEETIRALARKILEQSGMSVITAADGREGLDAFKKNADAINVVLLDMTMPHMNGNETFREMRRIRPDIPVVLTSGYNEQEATTRFAGKGLSGFIQKPYRFDSLIEVIRKALKI